MLYRLKNRIVEEVKQTDMIKEPIISSKGRSPVGQVGKSVQSGGCWKKQNLWSGKVST